MIKDPRFYLPPGYWEAFRLSGPNLIEEVQAGERLLNVYPGNSNFKGLIGNLVQVDLDGDHADFQGTLQAYAAADSAIKFNVAFILDAMTYVNDDELDQTILTVKKLLRERDSRIYWRCVPDLAQVPSAYPWTFDRHIELAERYGFEVASAQWDNDDRIFALWSSINRSQA